jgi:hypothetical protein
MLPHESSGGIVIPEKGSAEEEIEGEGIDEWIVEQLQMDSSRWGFSAAQFIEDEGYDEVSKL